MTGIILAGGKSRRMKKNKLLLQIDKKLVIETIVEKLKIVFDDVFIIGNSSLDRRFSGARLVKDMVSEKGPLGGIYTGLSVSQSKYNFICGCDMPFLNIDLIQYMVRKKTDYNVLIPKYGDCFEPLHAVYSKSIIPVIKEEIEQGTSSIQSIFPKVKVEYITEKEMEKFGNWREFFFNINTPLHLKKARRIASNR
jgi:molybdopterin-guanine dinucleotide biosynthesis protein A